MKFLFEDDTFSFEVPRTTGFANYFGADLGEVLATATRITDGDKASWHRAWKATAGRVAELRALPCRRAPGHRVGKPVAGVELPPQRGGLCARQPHRQPRSRSALRRPDQRKRMR